LHNELRASRCNCNSINVIIIIIIIIIISYHNSVGRATDYGLDGGVCSPAGVTDTSLKSYIALTGWAL
jgi:hypothetical protein